MIAQLKVLHPTSEKQPNVCCAICLEEISKDEIAAKPNSCGDVFHEVCLKEW